MSLVSTCQVTSASSHNNRVPTSSEKSSSAPAAKKCAPTADYGSTLQHRLRALTHMIAVVLTVPLLLFHMLCQLLSRRDEMVGAPSPLKTGERRTVLVTGAKMSKALHASRALWRAGHRVVLVETDKYWCSGSRLSRAISAFATVTDPRVDGNAYLADLKRVFDAHGCDTFLPVSSPFSAHYDAMFLRDLKGETVEAKGNTTDPVIRNRAMHNLHFSPRMCDILDDKHSFSSYCSDFLGLQEIMLPSHRLTSDAQVLQLNRTLLRRNDNSKFVLKNLAYDPLHRLDLFCLPRRNEADVVAYLDGVRADGNGISEHEPWQAQLFVESATEVACYAIVRHSRLRLFTACLSSASQLRYVHTGGRAPEGMERNAGHTPLIDAQTAACRAWLEMFCAAATANGEDLNGQVCLDFMCTAPESGTGEVKAYPLECNPRVHSMCCVFTPVDQRRYGQVLVGTTEEAKPNMYLVGDRWEPSSCSDTKVAEPSPTPRAEKQFTGWWANEFYGAKCNPIVLLLEVLLFLFMSCYFVLTGKFGRKRASSRAFRYAAKSKSANADWYRKHFGFRDADFDALDPLPFLGRNLLQPLVLFWGVFWTGNEWTKYDFCIGKVVEKNGD